MLPRRVFEGDYLFDPPRFGLIGRQLLERHSGAVKGGFDSLQPGVVAHLPADAETRSVSPGTTMSRAARSSIRRYSAERVEAFLLGGEPFGETQDAESELTPAVDVGGRDGDVAKAFQVAHRYS